MTERLRAAGFTPETGRTTSLRSVYWDTPEGELAAARLALRVRRTADGWIQTVKGQGDTPFSRFEWEAPVASEMPERAALPPDGDARGALVRRCFGRLAPLFATEFERTAWRVQPNASLAIELAADAGRIEADGRTEPIAELELERLAGSPLAFHRWAMRFAARHDLRLLHPSKGQRGLRLAGRLPDAARAVKAPPAAPDADVAAAAAAERVVQACLAHFIANLVPLHESNDPEAVHQARVALRRMRAALRFFRLPEAEPGWKRIGTLAGRLADALGRLRDADVFAAGTLAELRHTLADDPAVARLEQAIDALRERERGAVRASLAGRDATRLVLASSYLSQRLVRTVRGAAPADALQAEPFGPFAARRIAELDARLARRARRAGQPGRDDAAWHRVRIAAKNLRYALEFAACALPRPKRTRSALKRLASLQQRLGAAQDDAVAPMTAQRALAGQADAVGAARAAGLVQGWVARGRRHADHAKAARIVRRIGQDLCALHAREAPHAGAHGAPQVHAPDAAPAAAAAADATRSDAPPEAAAPGPGNLSARWPPE